MEAAMSQGTTPRILQNASVQWLADQAREKLAEDRAHASREVIAHWKHLAAQAPPES